MIAGAFPSSMWQHVVILPSVEPQVSEQEERRREGNMFEAVRRNEGLKIPESVVNKIEQIATVQQQNGTYSTCMFSVLCKRSRPKFVKGCSWLSIESLKMHASSKVHVICYWQSSAQYMYLLIFCPDGRFLPRATSK